MRGSALIINYSDAGVDFRLMTIGCLAFHAWDQVIRTANGAPAKRRTEMKSIRFLLSLIAVLVVQSILTRAQNLPDVQVWLTTVDRAAVFAHQPEPLHFSPRQSQFPAVAVNDMQQYQSIEGEMYPAETPQPQWLLPD